MLYSQIKKIIENMIDEIYTGREECSEVISYNLIKDQNVPITISATMIFSLGQIKISLSCPFLMIDESVKFEEIYMHDVADDEYRLMRLIAQFSSLLEKLKEWIHRDAPDMIRWGEGVIFDINGRTQRIPYPIKPKIEKKTKLKR
jgi:hypothetical protein